MICLNELKKKMEDVKMATIRFESELFVVVWVSKF